MRGNASIHGNTAQYGGGVYVLEVYIPEEKLQLSTERAPPVHENSSRSPKLSSASKT